MIDIYAPVIFYNGQGNTISIGCTKIITIDNASKRNIKYLLGQVSNPLSNEKVVLKTASDNNGKTVEHYIEVNTLIEMIYHAVASYNISIPWMKYIITSITMVGLISNTVTSEISKNIAESINSLLYTGVPDGNEIIVDQIPVINFMDVVRLDKNNLVYDITCLKNSIKDEGVLISQEPKIADVLGLRDSDIYSYNANNAAPIGPLIIKFMSQVVAMKPERYYTDSSSKSLKELVDIDSIEYIKKLKGAIRSYAENVMTPSRVIGIKHGNILIQTSDNVNYDWCIAFKLSENDVKSIIEALNEPSYDKVIAQYGARFIKYNGVNYVLSNKIMTTSINGSIISVEHTHLIDHVDYKLINPIKLQLQPTITAIGEAILGASSVDSILAKIYAVGLVNFEQKELCLYTDNRLSSNKAINEVINRIRRLQD